MLIRCATCHVACNRDHNRQPSNVYFSCCMKKRNTSQNKQKALRGRDEGGGGGGWGMRSQPQPAPLLPTHWIAGADSDAPVLGKVDTLCFSARCKATDVAPQLLKTRRKTIQCERRRTKAPQKKQSRCCGEIGCELCPCGQQDCAGSVAHFHHRFHRYIHVASCRLGMLRNIPSPTVAAAALVEPQLAIHGSMNPETESEVDAS